MRWYVIALYLGMVALAVGGPLASGDRVQAGVRGVAAIAGGVGVLVYLRHQAAAGSSRLAREVGAGQWVWGALVRPRTPNGDRGPFGGTLALTPDLEFQFTPDAWSGKHGASSESWASGSRITLAEARTDITGIRIQRMVLTPVAGTPVLLDGYCITGTLPDSCRAT